MIDQSTICAISTPAGMGAIAVVRLSGDEAISICDTVFNSPIKGKTLKEQSANTIHFGTIADGGTIIDEVVVALFKAPHSFTGEDIVEISCHGATYIQQQILELLIKKGARMALPGEFTQRAFLNGKMDLSQAEAVADLIASQSEAARKVALQQMRGGFSSELVNLRNELLQFISLIELELDFSEEDVEFADRTQLKSIVDKINDMLSKLIKSFSLGNAIKNGIPVAIVGHTNAGKSTLLNTLLNEERALVSDIHGTTRDSIEDTINIEGITFRFIDTAGIRTTTDEIENLGIERTYSKLKKATLVLLMLDVNDPDEKIHSAINSVKKRMNSSSQKLIVVINKIDLLDENEISNRFTHKEFLELTDTDAIVPISAKHNKNIEKLNTELLKTINTSALDNNEVIVTNARHYEALKKSHEAILRVANGLESNISGDLLAQDIREVLYYLGEITGTISTDEVLGNIFKNFCIGK